MESRIKVLIVEKERRLHNLWGQMLGQKIEVLRAENLEEAGEMFSANSDIKAVVIIGHTSDYLDTLPLVRVIRQSFKGPMIAASNVMEFRRELMKAGCDHECELYYSLPAVIFEILGFCEKKEGGEKNDGQHNGSSHDGSSHV